MVEAGAAGGAAGARRRGPAVHACGGKSLSGAPPLSCGEPGEQELTLIFQVT
jgi:hypothetical protein